MAGNRKIIYGSVFLSSIPFALTHYINSSFISSFVGEEQMGLIYTLGALGALVVFSLAPRIMQKIGGYKFLLWVGILNALYFYLMSKVQNAGAIVLLFIIGFSLTMIVNFILDEFLKIFSKNNAIGSVRGVSLVVTHIAFILVQVTFWLFLGAHSLRTVYLFSAFATLIFVLVTFLGFRNLPEPEYDKISKIKFLGAFFQNKNLLRAYSLGFLLQLFYAWMIIYTPLYLTRHLGFTWSQIGIMFAVMLLPFIFIPLPFGKYSDKFGERSTLMLGFLIASLSVFCIFISSHLGLLAWTMLLLTTRIGAAIIEVSCDAYFFKHIRAENDEFIGVYRSAYPLALIIGPLLASFIFLIVPAFNFLYLILTGFMLYGVYLASEIGRHEI